MGLVVKRKAGEGVGLFDAETMELLGLVHIEEVRQSYCRLRIEAPRRVRICRVKSEEPVVDDGSPVFSMEGARWNVPRGPRPAA